MMYDNYPYNLFNQSSLSSFDRQRYEAEKQHREQQDNIRDLIKAAHDFLDAAQKVRPEYQLQAQQAVFAAVFERMMQSPCGGINK